MMIKFRHACLCISPVEMPGWRKQILRTSKGVDSDMIIEQFEKAANPWDETGTWSCSAWHIRNPMVLGYGSSQKDNPKLVLNSLLASEGITQDSKFPFVLKKAFGRPVDIQVGIKLETYLELYALKQMSSQCPVSQLHSYTSAASLQRTEGTTCC